MHPQRQIRTFTNADSVHACADSRALADAGILVGRFAANRWIHAGPPIGATPSLARSDERRAAPQSGTAGSRDTRERPALGPDRHRRRRLHQDQPGTA